MLASDETEVVPRLPALPALESLPRPTKGVLAEVIRDAIAETADTALFQNYVGSFQSFVGASRNDTST